MMLLTDSPVEIRLLDTAYSGDVVSLSHRMDTINRKTLMLVNAHEAVYWRLEEYKKTGTYYLLAEGDFDMEYCLTAYESLSYWQPVALEPRLEDERRQLWRIMSHPNGRYKINNVKYLDKYLAHVPSEVLNGDEKIAMISPPYEVIEIGYVQMHWHLLFKDELDCPYS